MELLPNYSKRVYGLDVYRAIAILLVVQTHGSFMLKGTFLQEFPWIKLIDGVELFFVLSGFLIGSILIKIIVSNNYKLRIPEILTFWKRRWFRTIPNYYLILLFNFLFVKYGIINGDLTQFNYKFFLFIQNFSQPFHGFFWESWSLSIEEWFYIFLPVLLILVLKFFPSRKGILISIFILLTFPLVYRIIHVSDKVDYFWWEVKFKKIVLMRLDTIIYGVLAAYIKHFFTSFWKKYARHFFIAGIFILSIMPYYDIIPNSFFAKTFYFNCITIGAMFLLPFADSVKDLKSFFGKFMTHISLISYSMYLINLGLVVQVINKNFAITSPQDGLMKYVIYWTVVIVGSTIIYFFFERPILNLRDKTFRIKG